MLDISGKGTVIGLNTLISSSIESESESESESKSESESEKLRNRQGLIPT